MADDSLPSGRPVFPRWSNYALPLIILGVFGAATYLPTLFTFGASPKTLNVGYQPKQPVPYSHALHVGQLGMDCRYCHSTVDRAAFAAIPPTQTCMNCHVSVRTDSEKLKPVFDSWNTGKPVEWVKVHDLADYVYFNHASHVNSGVGCVSCHGRIDQMEVVHQAQPLSMGWCLDCHRAPEKNLRPRSEVTNMAYAPQTENGETPEQAQLRVGNRLKELYNIHDTQYMQSCSTCHR